MCDSVRTPADRTYRRRCQVAACLCLAGYVTCSQISLRLHGYALGLILAAFGGACFFGELVAVGMLAFRLRDEFQRVLLTRSLVWATVATMALTTIWGFVELHGRGEVPHLDVIWIPMLLVILTAFAKVILFRQHKSSAGLDA